MHNYGEHLVEEEEKSAKWLAEEPEEPLPEDITEEEIKKRDEEKAKKAREGSARRRKMVGFLWMSTIGLIREILSVHQNERLYCFYHPMPCLERLVNGRRGCESYIEEVCGTSMEGWFKWTRRSRTRALKEFSGI